MAGLVGRVVVRKGSLRSVKFWQGRAWQDWRAQVCCGMVSCVKAGQGIARYGKAGKSWLVMVTCGMA